MSEQTSSTDLAARAQRLRKLRDGALLLPVLGIFLFLTPILGLFAGSSDSAIPAIFVYVYGVWLMLIGLSAWLSRRLAREDQRTQIDAQDGE